MPTGEATFDFGMSRFGRHLLVLQAMEVNSMTTNLSRDEARNKIIQAVNRFKVGFWSSTRYQPKLIGPKQIQWAVFIARQRLLVSPEVLIAAGFNGVKAK